MKKIFVLLTVMFYLCSVILTSQENYFIQNKGQFAENILYVGNSDGYKVIISKDGIYLNHQLLTPTVESNKFQNSQNNEEKEYRLQSDNIRMKLVNSNIQHNINEKSITCSKPLSYTMDFLNFSDKEFWISDVSLYQKITINEVYNDIDLVFYFEDNNIRYDFHLDEKANPNDIELKFEGCKNVTLKNNEIQLVTELGILTNGRIETIIPEINEKLSTKLLQTSVNSFKIEVSEYEKNLKIIIDPLIYSRYYFKDNDQYFFDFHSLHKVESDYLIKHGGRPYSFEFQDTLFTDTLISNSVGFATLFDNDLKTIKKRYMTIASEFKSYVGNNRFLVSIGRWKNSLNLITTFKCYNKTDTCNRYLALIDLNQKKIINAAGINTDDYFHYSNQKNLFYSVTSGSQISYLTDNAYDKVEDYANGKRTGHLLVISGDLDSVYFASFLGDLSKSGEAVCTDKEGNIYILSRGNTYDANVSVHDFVNPEDKKHGIDSDFSTLIKFDKDYNFIKSVGYYNTICKKMVYNDVTNEIVIAGTTSHWNNLLTMKPIVLSFDTDLKFRNKFITNAGSLSGVGIELTWIDMKAGNITVDKSGDLYILGTLISSPEGEFDYPVLGDIAYKTSSNIDPNSNQHSPSDVFITKLDKDLKKILYSTVYGGGLHEWAYFIEAIDSIVTIVGQTRSDNLVITTDGVKYPQLGPFEQLQCLFFARFKLPNPLSVDEIVKLNVPIIYPNPADSYLQLSEDDSQQYERYEIYDITGRKLQSQLLSDNRIDISILEQGTYYLLLYNSSGLSVTTGFVKIGD